MSAERARVPSDRSLRLFVGIEIDEAVRKLALDVARSLELSGAELRYERLEKMHVTLAFLGRTWAKNLEKIEAALQSVAAGQKRFELHFDRVGAFPNERRPRVIWLGCTTEDPAFGLCARALRAALVRLGYEFPSEAVAHVTLCRAKPPLRGMPPVHLARAATLAVTRLCLYESIPAGRTTVYEVRSTAPLG